MRNALAICRNGTAMTRNPYTQRAEANRPSFAPDCTQAQRDAYVRACRASEPVEQPLCEHWQDECDHCDLLWALQREAEADGA
jgi:hypothetical protein